MEGFPDDIAMGDLSSFPRENPAVLAAQAKQAAAAAKEEEAERKRQEAALKKMQEMMKADQDGVANASAAPKRGRPPKSASAAATSGAPAAQTLPVVPASEKALQLKVTKIRLYFQYLAHKLKIKEPSKYPTDEKGINDLLAAVEGDLCSQGGIQNAANFYVTACGLVEQLTQVWNPLGLQLSGPRASFEQTVAQNRKVWEETVTEFAIHNAEWFMVGSFWRLVQLTVQTANVVSNANKAGAAAAADVPASEELRKQAEGM